MKQIYKSVSFPKAFNKQKETKVLKLAFSDKDAETASFIRGLDSSQVRNLLNNKSIEELHEKANYENRSLNNTCLLLIKENLIKYKIKNNNQLDLFIANPANSLHLETPSVTFKNNKRRSIFNWYPYIEGFSYDFVEEILEYIVAEPKFIYDPFAGTGTTILVASQRNIKSGFSEINPLMKFIIETKIATLINYSSIIKVNFGKVNNLFEVLQKEVFKYHKLNEHYLNFIEKGFFNEEILKQLVIIKETILHSDLSRLVKDILLIALSAIIVKESNMIRRADLRYKKNKEFDEIEDDVIGLFIRKSKTIFSDLANYKNLKLARTEFVSADAKQINTRYENKFDLVVTSPPYVNGTNYFRNTKLELLLLDFIKDENELKHFRTEFSSYLDLSKK